MRVTRRAFVVGGGAAAVAAATGRLGWTAEAQTAGLTGFPGSGWQFESVLLDSGRYDPAYKFGANYGGEWRQIFHPTLMRVDDKLSAPEAKWYLWFWTHDRPSCRLYVADALLPAGTSGGFRPHSAGATTTPPGRVVFPLTTSPGGAGCSPEAKSAPSRYLWNSHRATFDQSDRCHYSSGDVVWVPGAGGAAGAFYATPHGLGLFWDGTASYNMQNTVLVKSLDGINWTRVSGDNVHDRPILPLGTGSAKMDDPLAEWDSYQIAYGRFLRDRDGNIARYTGDGYENVYVWFYRGQKKVRTATGVQTNTYAIGAAVSDDLTTWRKVQPRDRPLFNPNAGALCGIGSALLIDGEIHLVVNTEDNLGGDPTTLEKFTTYLKRPSVPGSLKSWSDDAGTLLYKDPDPNVTGGPGNYALDGTDHVMVYDGWTGTYNTSTSRMRISLARRSA